MDFYVCICVYNMSEVPSFCMDIYMFVWVHMCTYAYICMYTTHLGFPLSIDVFNHVCKRLIGVCEAKIALLCINFNQNNLAPKEDIDLGV